MSKKNIFSYTLPVFIIIFGFLGILSQTKASSTDNVSGYAWSSNIGWISFNATNDTDPNTAGIQPSPTDYGVTMDMTTGVLTGYAWSSNIGWIQFGGFTNCPSYSANPTCQAKVDFAPYTLGTGGFLVPVSGWARAVAPNAINDPHCSSNPSSDSFNDGCWDGWISLKGSNFGVLMNTTTGHLSDYAWGSDVIGWVKFDAKVTIVPPLAPTITLTASEAGNFSNHGTNITVPPNTNVNLTWVTTNVLNCTAGAAATPSSASWNSGAITTIPNGSKSGITPDQTQSNQPNLYKLTCTGTNNTQLTGIAHVTVSPVPPLCPVGYSGTPPNCTIASVCPVGYSGTPPNCTIALVCPAGYSGTPPNCTIASVINGACLSGPFSSTPPLANLCTGGSMLKQPPGLTGTGISPDLWTWKCDGSGVGHTDKICTAAKTTPPQPGSPSITLDSGCYNHKGYLKLTISSITSGSSCSGLSPIPSNGQRWLTAPGGNQTQYVTNATPGPGTSYSLTCTDSVNGSASTVSSPVLDTPCAVNTVPPPQPLPSPTPIFQEI